MSESPDDATFLTAESTRQVTFSLSQQFRVARQVEKVREEGRCRLGCLGRHLGPFGVSGVPLESLVGPWAFFGDPIGLLERF